MTEQWPSGAVQNQRPGVRAGYLWAGGIATAVVAGLVAWVGTIVSDVVFDVQMLLPVPEESSDSPRQVRIPCEDLARAGRPVQDS